MTDMPKIEVEMAFLTQEEGGRKRPPVQMKPTLYRPHLVIGESQYLGVVFLAAPEHVDAKCPFTATLGLVYHANADHSPLVPGAEFTVREGRRVVGVGRVVQ